MNMESTECTFRYILSDWDRNEVWSGWDWCFYGKHT